MKSIWKKSFAVVVAALCVFSTVACGKGANDDDDEEDWLPGASHTHVYNPYMTKKQPTCTQKGENLLKCSCGKTRTEEVGRIAHDMSDGVCRSCGAEESKGLHIYIKDGNAIVGGIGTCTSADIIIPEMKDGILVTEIKDRAFESEKFRTVNIPSGIAYIDSSAFNKCANLEGIMVSENNTAYCSIDENLYTEDGEILIRYAFGRKDDSFKFHENTTEIGKAAFCDALALTSITIPNRVSSIGDRAFAGCDNLEKVSIGSGVQTIGSAPFNSCDSLASITVDEENIYYQSIDGNLYTEDASLLLQYANGKSDEVFVVPDSVTIIGESALSDNAILTRIELPKSLKEIRRQAFYGVTATTLTFAGTKAQWQTIADKASGNNWQYNFLAPYVECIDGNVSIKSGY